MGRNVWPAQFSDRFSSEYRGNVYLSVVHHYCRVPLDYLDPSKCSCRGIGLVIIFMGADFSSLIMSALPHLAAIIKWNPLNMVFVINQLANSSYEKFSDLSLLQIITGNLIYAVIFIVIGDLLFKSRRV